MFDGISKKSWNNIFTDVLEGSKWSKKILEDSKRSQKVLDYLKRFKKALNSLLKTNTQFL